MPRRKKPSATDTRLAIAGSLREWGVQPMKHGIHANFSRKITSLALEGVDPRLNNGSTKIDLNDQITIPKDRDEAIRMVYVLDMLEYKDDEAFDIRAEEVADALEQLLTKGDNANQILQWPPFFQITGTTRVKKKPAFTRFQESSLDPFKRLSIVNEGLSKAKLAYEDCSDESWLNGYAFEAIVASYAVHNEPCYRCRARKSLIWCGGSSASWRDLFCRSCKSCFEIKSKADKMAVDRIFQYDELHGGSFHRWCAEGYEDRVEGSDFIVLVSRKPSYIKRDEWAWTVEIAEVGSVRPKVSPYSIATKCQDKRGSLRTIVMLKNRSKWFSIPMEKQPDLQSIFREAYEEAFPGEWEQVSANGAPAKAEESKVPDTPVPDSSVNVEELRCNLQDLSVDDWEDLDDSDSD